MGPEQYKIPNAYGNDPSLLGWEEYRTPRGRVYHLDHNTRTAVLTWSPYNAREEAKAFKPKFSSGRLKDAERPRLFATNRADHCLFKIVEKQAMLDVAFDSPQRRFAPRCLPDTRQQFLEEIQSRISDEQSKKILWLYGKSKVGKSALMQTIASVLATPPQSHRSRVFNCLNPLAFSFNTPIGPLVPPPGPTFSLPPMSSLPPPPQMSSLPPPPPFPSMPSLSSVPPPMLPSMSPLPMLFSNPISPSKLILCATVFLSEVSDIQRIPITIAYQLALEYPNYQSYLVELFEDAHPELLSYALEEQFEKLFFKPFTRFREELFGKDNILILIDGLNWPDDTMRRLVRLIAKFVQQHSAIKWLIASRHHVEDIYPDIGDCELLEVPEDQVVERYKEEAHRVAQSLFSERAAISDELDSVSQSHLPRCYAGTRRDILSVIRNWAVDRNRMRRILWVRGNRGVGKSAIMRTLYEEQAIGIRAVIFPQGRGGPRIVIKTIAQHFYLKYARYRDYITVLLTQYPDLFTVSLSEQFHMLIAQPFSMLEVLEEVRDTVLILLDEIEYPSRGGGSLEELILLVCRFVRENRMAPLRWVVTSTYDTEAHAIGLSGIIHENLPNHVSTSPAFEAKTQEPIHFAFSHLEGQGSYATLDVAITLSDMKEYLTGELGPLGIDTGLFFENVVSVLKQYELGILASGSFVLASTVVRLARECSLNNLPSGSEERQLVNLALSTRFGGLSFAIHASVLLDIIYSQITLPAITNNPTTRNLLFLFYQAANGPMDFVLACNYLGLAQDESYSALRGLQSVLDIPPPQDAFRRPPKAYDVYFTNYLENFWLKQIGQSGWYEILRRSLYILGQSYDQGGGRPLLFALLYVNDSASVRSVTDVSRIQLSWPDPPRIPTLQQDLFEVSLERVVFEARMTPNQDEGALFAHLKCLFQCLDYRRYIKYFGTRENLMGLRIAPKFLTQYFKDWGVLREIAVSEMDLNHVLWDENACVCYLAWNTLPGANVLEEILARSIADPQAKAVFFFGVPSRQIQKDIKQHFEYVALETGGSGLLGFLLGQGDRGCLFLVCADNNRGGMYLLPYDHVENSE